MELTREQIKAIKQIEKISFEGIEYNVFAYAIKEKLVEFTLKKNMNCSTCLEIKVSAPLVKGEVKLGKVKKL